MGNVGKDRFFDLEIFKHGLNNHACRGEGGIIGVAVQLRRKLIMAILRQDAAFQAPLQVAGNIFPAFGQGGFVAFQQDNAIPGQKAGRGNARPHQPAANNADCVNIGRGYAACGWQFGDIFFCHENMAQCL